MKFLLKSFCLFFICLSVLVCLFSCKKAPAQIEAQTMDYKVAETIENIDGIENVDDETIKALSVVVRSNILSENQNALAYENSYGSAYSGKNEHILSLTKETANEILTKNESPASFEIVTDEKISAWEVEIKKSDILKFLNKNNISLSSISKIEPEINESGELVSLCVGGKNIPYLSLKEEFNLKSSKITNIESTLTSVKIYGEGEDENKQIFNLKSSQKLSSEGKNYKELLKHFFNDFDLKTTN